MRAKVFIIADNLGTGGAQRQIVEYLKYADRKKFAIKIINLDKDYNLLGAEIQELGYEIISISHKGFFNLKTVVTLTRLFRKEKPVIIYTYLFTADCYGRLAGKLAGVPIIISSVRNLDLWKKAHHILAAKILAKFTDTFVINAENLKSFLVNKEKVEPQKILTIYNGIDLNRFSRLKTSKITKRELGIPQDAFVVGMVARFHEQKDYKTFFEAAKRVIKEIPNTYFIAVGDGPARKEIEGFVEQNGISKNVVFTGLKKDASDLINCFDIGVLSSHYEGCSNAIMEYMSCSKTVIASDVGGNSELVVNGITGYIIEPGNPNAMYEKINLLLKDPDLRYEMGKRAKGRIEDKFTVQVMVKKTESLFEELLSKKKLFEVSSARLGYIVSLFPCWSETFILNEIIELEKRGFEVTIFSIRKDLEEFTQDKARRLIKNTRYVYTLKAVIALFYWLFRRPLVFISLIYIILNQRYSSFKEAFKNTYAFSSGCYFASIARKERLTHIHAHFATYPALAALAMSKLTNIPFTFTAHAHDIFLEKTLLNEKVMATKAVITISDYNKRYIGDYCRNGAYSKIKVVHCGLDLSEFANLNGEHKESMILSVGRLTKMKGFEYLIKACSRLKNQIPIKCHIVGDGPLRDELERLIIALGARDYIRIDGVLDNNKIKQLMLDSAVFILPSVWDKQDGQDGIPVVLMEAMASGIPVVSSNISGIPELVEDGKTGLLAESGNDEQLSQKILQLLSDKELRARLAIAGRKRIEEEFDVVKSVDKLTEVFNS